MSRIYLDATGRQNVTFSFTARDIDGSLDNAVQPIAVQYRLGDSGAWINLPAGAIADASTGPSLATASQRVTVTLPADANNAAQLQARVNTANAVGSDEWIGIDDIAVNSIPSVAVAPDSLSVADASVIEGNAGTTDLSFAVARTGGSNGAVSASYSIELTGTTLTNDLGTTTLTGTLSFAAGQTSATIRVPVSGDLSVKGNETFTVTLFAPVGGVRLGDASALGTIVNDDFPAAANVFINEINYDPVGSMALSWMPSPASSPPPGRTTMRGRRPVRW